MFCLIWTVQTSKHAVWLGSHCYELCYPKQQALLRYSQFAKNVATTEIMAECWKFRMRERNVEYESQKNRNLKKWLSFQGTKTNLSQKFRKNGLKILKTLTHRKCSCYLQTRGVSFVWNGSGWRVGMVLWVKWHNTQNRNFFKNCKFPRSRNTIVFFAKKKRSLLFLKKKFIFSSS